MDKAHTNNVYVVEYPKYMVNGSTETYSFTSRGATAHFVEECYRNNAKPFILAGHAFTPRTFAIFCKTGLYQPKDLLQDVNALFLDKE